MNNKANTSKLDTRESTYALLVRSEEKSRSLLETIAYSLVVLSAVFSIWQVAHQPVILPSNITTDSVVAVQTTSQQHS